MNLFISGPTTPTTVPVAPIQNAQQTNALDSLGLLELGSARIPSQSLTTSISTSTDQYVVYNKNRFKVSLNPSKDSNNSNILNIEVIFYNIDTQKLQMQPPSLTGILPSAIAQQTICVTNP
ncbi:2477_t:CDS:2 [Gigaspora margarita]|uniref:2477_t:CDS:1 n=1 Tax=Gigaspora margarita TaxID=4874 RepID=A0ABN7VR82_GIGMA|nr:2477_t:CDS:2 [Gigaspora margarita]